MTANLAAATDDAASLPAQDLVIVTLKAHSIPGAAADIARLMAPGGCAVFMTNGIPWWWRYGLGGAEGPLPLLDPDGVIWKTIGPQRVLPCLTFSVNEVVRPGVIHHSRLNDWVLGEADGAADGGKTARLDRVARLFDRAGLKARTVPDIRLEIWRKLLINSSQSTVAALTRLDSQAMARADDVRRLKDSIVAETLAVAAACGWDLRDPAATAATVALGAPANAPTNRSSMLQDVLAGRPMEVEALLGQVQAFAREHVVRTPVIDVMVPLLRGLDLSMQQS